MSDKPEKPLADPLDGTITFGLKRKYAPVIITDEIARYLRMGGHDPSSLNKITWPLYGANNHAHAKFLVQIDDYDSSSPFGEWKSFPSPNEIIDKPKPVVVFCQSTNNKYRSITPYERVDLSYEMYPVEVTEVFAGSTRVQYCIVEMVDERYWWKMHPIMDRYEIPGSPGEFRDGMFKNGLNFIDRSDRTRFIEKTLHQVSEDTPVTEPWNAGLVLASIINLFGEYSHMHGDDEFPFMKNVVINMQDSRLLGENFQYFPPEFQESEYVNPVVGFDIIDVTAVGRTFAEFIDEIMTSSGLALRCLPGGAEYSSSLENQPDDISNLNNYPHQSTYAVTSFEPDVVRNVFGHDREFYSFHQILNGEIKAALQNVGGPQAQDGLVVPWRDSDITATPIPEKCVVFLPKTLNNGSSETDKLVSITTNNGIPFTTDDFSNPTSSFKYTLGGNRKTIYGHLHARFSLDEDGNEVWDNEEDCNLYADRLSKRYYSRFALGRVDIKLHGFLATSLGELRNMSIQTIVWHLSEIGPTTHLYASRDNPLLGFRTDLKQSQDDIKTSGGGLVYPRNDGSVLIEAGQGSTGSLHHAVITGYEGELPNWNSKYKARSVSDPSLEIDTAIIPIRPHSTQGVNCQPLELSDPCIIGVLPETALNPTHDIINAGVGRAAISTLDSIISESNLFGTRSLNSNIDEGTAYEYFRLGDGRICVLFVFEIPQVINCELIVPPGASATGERLTTESMTFYTRSNLYGY